MEYLVGIAILFVFGVCIYSLIDVLNQISKVD